MPLGSNKISVNKNRLSVGSGPLPSDPASFSIDAVLSNDYLDAQGYTKSFFFDTDQTVTYNITSNRPNATLDYSIAGTGIVAEDFNGPISGNITTDSNGDATITRTVESDLSLNTNVSFTLSLIRESTSQVMATSNTFNIYNIEFPNVSVTGANVNTLDASINNLVFDGTVHEIKEDANITINNLGTLQDNVFQVMIAANVIYSPQANYVYIDRPLPVAVVAGGGGGSANDAGGGGAGGEVVYLKDSYVSQLTETTYTVTVGEGGLSGVSGGNTVVFGGTAFEISAEGGGSPTGGNGGSVAGVSGGSQATNNPFNNTYGGGGGAGRYRYYNWNTDTDIDVSATGSAGRVERDGFTSRYNAFGGAGANPGFLSDQITREIWPNYTGTNPTQVIYYGAGGGGGAFTTSGGIEVRGNSGDAGDSLGKGGTSSVSPTQGRDGTGMGGGGSGTGAYSVAGGNGVAILRVPKGPDFRFITSSNY